MKQDQRVVKNDEVHTQIQMFIIVLLEYGTYHQDLWCAKGEQVRCAKVAKFLLSAQISIVYQVFIFLLQTTAINSHGRHVYVKKIASTIFITYIVVALPAPR